MRTKLIYFALILSLLGLSRSGQLEAQTDPQNVVATFIANPVNGTIIDNRSAFQRQNNYHSFRAYGTGTWGVTMQWSDAMNPYVWTTYGSTATVTNSSPASGIGFGVDAATPQPYHNFVQFVTTGNATIAGYFGTKNAWWTNTAGSISFPITANQGGTSGLFIVDQMYGNLPAACTAATSANLSLLITIPWVGITSQTFNCNVWFVRGGIVKPAAAAVVTFAGSITAPDAQVFDTSVGGAGSIKIGQAYARPEWFGAVGNNSSVDSAPGITSAFYSMPSNDGGVHVHGKVELLPGSTYYLKSYSPLSPNATAATIIPVSNGFTLMGNNAILDTTGLSNNVVGLQMVYFPFTLGTGQVCNGTNWDCGAPFEGEAKYNGIAMSNVAIGDPTITVADGTKFTVGHAIYMQGGSAVSDGSIPSGEQNIVTGISGNVITLMWPAAKQYPSGVLNSSYPTVAVDVDYLTSTDLVIQDVRTEGATGGIGMDLTDSMLATLKHIYNNTYKSDLVNGNNRYLTISDSTTFVASATSQSCLAGGLYQMARNSGNVTILNSSFVGLRNYVCSFIGVNEGSFNFQGHYNQFIGEGEVGIATNVGSGFDLSFNSFWTYGSWNGQGLISTICCGTSPILAAHISNNTIYNYNTEESSLVGGGPGAVISGNTVYAPNAVVNTVVLANMSGGQFTGNTITSGGSGVAVSDDQTDFQMIGNNFIGIGDVFGGSCIVFNTSMATTSGPNVIGNNCEGFYYGIHTNAPSNFPNRQIGFNTIKGATTAYTAGLVPIDYNGTFSQVLLGGANPTTLINQGVNNLGQIYSQSVGGASGATPFGAPMLVLDSPGASDVDLLTPTGGSSAYDVISPTARGYMQIMPGGAVSLSADAANNELQVYPVGTYIKPTGYSTLPTCAASFVTGVSVGVGTMVPITNSNTQTINTQITASGAYTGLAICQFISGSSYGWFYH